MTSPLGTRAMRDKEATKRRRMFATPRSAAASAPSERGAILILALVYIISISLIVGAIADWAMNDLNNSTHLDTSSAKAYAATSAVDVAVQSIRYTPLISQTQSPSVGYCWTPPSGSVSQLSTNGYTVAVWCTTLVSLDSANTRVVTIFACLSTLTSTQCQAPNADIVTVQVTFDDYPAVGSPALTSTCTATCGESATTDYWNWTAAG
jgi:hypothetical protein